MKPPMPPLSLVFPVFRMRALLCPLPALLRRALPLLPLFHSHVHPQPFAARITPPAAALVLVYPISQCRKVLQRRRTHKERRRFLLHGPQELKFPTGSGPVNQYHQAVVGSLGPHPVRCLVRSFGPHLARSQLALGRLLVSGTHVVLDVPASLRVR